MKSRKPLLLIAALLLAAVLAAQTRGTITAVNTVAADQVAPIMALLDAWVAVEFVDQVADADGVLTDQPMYPGGGQEFIDAQHKANMTRYMTMGCEAVPASCPAFLRTHVDKVNEGRDGADAALDDAFQEPTGR